ncbi:unnamed protein product [Sphagnum troendelagicum]|uniref:GS catalytic domain-containing protein n=1 Tax=Sphagnum troendelagicum TaxID=128251 RepID=A0ABP0TWA3_9BRYO
MAENSGNREQDHERIRTVCAQVPLIDAHAHNVVGLDSNLPFLVCLREARGLDAVRQSLAFQRSLKELAVLYGCEPTLAAIEQYRQSVGLEAISQKCFDAANIEFVLLDDGLTMDKMVSIGWHRKFIPGVHRLLCIETVAEAILNQGIQANMRWTLESFDHRFISTLDSYPFKVVAFKSIAAYRSGLRINPFVSAQESEDALHENLRWGSPVRVSKKALVDFIFVRALEVATQRGIPMQIHTGFGDKDLQLELANPLHLRAVLEHSTFSQCRVVLLHGSYPFMREASYLAGVYPQVHLDFGLVVPKLSVRGMRCAVSDLLDLAPVNKIMFSTDGYAFPETFYLGAKWSREILARVLIEAFDNGDMLLEEALAAADGILGRNALEFYKLDGRDGFSASTDNLTKLQQSISGTNLLHVRLLLADGSGQRRCRVIPLERFEGVVVSHGVGYAQAGMGMTSFSDVPAADSGLSVVGEIRLMPDMTTKRRLPWFMEHEVVLVDMHVKPGVPWQLCPRSTLRRISQTLEKDYGLVVRAGFESEFYLMKQSAGPKRWEGVDTTPYCSSAGFDASASIMSEMSSVLLALDIGIEQMHCESGGGQFEMAMSHVPCLSAADNLLLIREAIIAIAQKHLLHATFLPKYNSAAAGSGSHVHLSIWQGASNVFMARGPGGAHGMSKIGQEFLAGVLHHLPAILAFTAPIPNSYARIQPNTWSGAYQCWGRDNREAPLRTASPPGVDSDLVSNFELKSFDGCANPHLGLAAIIAAGIDGLQKHHQLPEPVDVNPSVLEAGKVSRLPRTLGEAIKALESDKVLLEHLGAPLVTAICAIRKAEVQFYKDTEDSEELLVDRY